MQFLWDWSGLNHNLSPFTLRFIPSLLPFLHLLAPEEPSCPSEMKKCELALTVAFPWPESVKVAESEPVLASALPAPSHIICTLWKMLSLWVDYLLTSFTAVWGYGGTESLSERSEVIRRDHDLNHYQPGRQRCRLIISLVLEIVLLI